MACRFETWVLLWILRLKVKSRLVSWGSCNCSVMKRNILSAGLLERINTKGLKRFIVGAGLAGYGSKAKIILCVDRGVGCAHEQRIAQRHSHDLSMLASRTFYRQFEPCSPKPGLVFFAYFFRFVSHVFSVSRCGDLLAFPLSRGYSAGGRLRYNCSPVPLD